ncbi:hypothetical protein O6H91_01G042200 [Diphasiastrum complanatum]|uniref:Uncharacterized protein n=1 Tax=Diphasiastrum complanatum TaxID=34168 RepID=A0ACC2EQE9_DIPCM|nr:hypothetical protein O6H91_01G042200 [Diphasiastrum complanatum]
MLGSACIRLCILGRATTTPTSAFSQSSQSGKRLYSGNVVSRQPLSPALPQAIHGSSVFARGKSNTLNDGKESCLLKHSFSLTRFKNHPSSCLLAANGVFVATIWHALLPSRHLSSVVLDRLSPTERSQGVAITSEGCPKQAEWAHVIGPVSCGMCQGFAAEDGLGLVGSLGALQGRFGKRTVAAGWQDGSWNVACDARPARWLHGRHSAWLLFGVCSSVASAGAIAASSLHANNLALAEALSGDDEEAQRQNKSIASHGKPVLKEYTVTGIPGDGRCLFRAVAHGACLRKGKPAPTESTQRKLADELRNKVVDELILRRSETEWFIEGDFDIYTERMREPHVWGGEPEILMLSHVLKMPITVYMSEKNSKGLIAIAEYGQEYGKGRPVRLLYHGFGHYDALQLPGDT